jgi:hypothetical protein
MNLTASLMLIFTSSLLGSCGKNITGPPPVPSPSFTPAPLLMQPLEVRGGEFYPELYGAIICCTEPYAKAYHWPLISEEALRLLADNRANYTHIRLGPHHIDNEGPGYSGYLLVGDRYDLNQWDEGFWARVKNILTVAKGLGIYVEIDVVDAWVLERPQISPWGQFENVNGYGADCYVLRKAPDPIIERWVRKVVSETRSFPNVMYQIGNETFDCRGLLEAEFELGVKDIIKSELNGINRLIGTNSHDPFIESKVDYVSYHQSNAPSNIGKPVQVNEYGDNVTPEDYNRELNLGYSRGTYFHLWRAGMDDADWLKSLGYLKQFREAH